MNQETSIGIVIPSLAPSHLLRKCLLSIAEQTLRPKIVVIVAQSDLANYREIIEGVELNVVLLLSSIGLSRSRNMGFVYVEENCEIVGFVDADTCIDSKYLENVAQELIWADACVGRVQTQGKARLNFSPTSTMITKRNVWHTAIESGFFSKTATLREVGLYAENLGLGSGTRLGSGEGTDLYCRFIERGFNIVYAPELVSEEFVDSIEQPIFKHSSYAVGTGYVYAKHFNFFVGVTRIFAPLFSRKSAFSLEQRLAIVQGRMIGFYIGMTD
jgi:glycosyltransferase involved in cell wall biosynthesis